jgi:hypothetical protein
MGHPVDLLWALEAAVSLLASHEPTIATQLLAACDRERARTGAPRPSYSASRLRSVSSLTDGEHRDLESALVLAESALDGLIDTV